MPLSDMLKYMVESNDPATWEATRQKRLMGEMELQEKQRAMQATQDLRDLYAKGGQIDMNKVMAIDPAAGMQMQKFNNEQMLQQMKMLESQGSIEETRRKTQEAKQHTFANTIGPLIENWQDSLGNRQPTEQDLEAFKGRLGGALKFLDESYGYKPDVPIDPYHPEHILGTAESLGYASRRAKTMGAQEEAYASGVGRAQAPVPASVESGPYGYRLKPGLTSGMGNAPSGAIPAPSIEFEGRTYAGSEFAKAIMAEQDPARRAKMNEYIDASMASQKANIPSSQFVTPEQEAQMRIQEKEKEIRTAEGAKADVQRTEEGKRITESFKRAMGEGGVSRVMKMISESTSGKGEELLAKTAGAVPGVGATPGMENIGALNTIAGELRKTIERSPGAQSDKDVALAALDAAAIADPSIPYNQRMKGFLEFTRIIKERAKDLGIDPKQLGIDVDTSTGSSMPTAKTDAEAEDLVKKLKPGQSFIGPDGKTHTIKGL